MNDLAPLAQVLALPEATNWVFPNGHLSVPLGPHYEGRGWFPISISELEKTMAGKALDLGGLVPPGLDEARDHALEMIDALDVAPENLILMGFSQGGMLATDLAVRLPQAPRGLAILSGALVNGDEWARLAPAHSGLPFFQSHGLKDTILSFAGAQKLEQFLLAAGWKGQLLRFEGGHEIPPNVLASLSAYLKRRLGI
jgi:phospholipase/carboxylesterase